MVQGDGILVGMDDEVLSQVMSEKIDLEGRFVAWAH